MIKTAVLTIASTALLTGCSVVPSALANAAAGSEQLVKAEHPQCDHGAALVHYLATGDNQGMPGLDEHYANEVGTLSVAQERAVADKWIETCDQTANAEQQQADANAQAVTLQQQEVAQAATEQVAAAKVRAQQNKSLATECAEASGRFDAGLQRCYSTTPGNPSGKPGEGCVGPTGGPNYLYPVDGSFATGRNSYGRAHPGCFT
jgi:hypothetical protein